MNAYPLSKGVNRRRMPTPFPRGSIAQSAIGGIGAWRTATTPRYHATPPQPSPAFAGEGASSVAAVGACVEQTIPFVLHTQRFVRRLRIRVVAFDEQAQAHHAVGLLRQRFHMPVQRREHALAAVFLR